MEIHQFRAKCPCCGEWNGFMVSKEEIDNDFHFTCDFCDGEFMLSRYEKKEEEIKLRGVNKLKD